MKNKPVAITTAWINLVLGLLIVVEVAFLVWGMRFANPACQRIISYADNDVSRFYGYVPGAKTLLGLLHTPIYNPLWWLIGFAFGWGLFEWRVPYETKSRLRPGVMASLGLPALPGFRDVRRRPSDSAGKGRGADEFPLSGTDRCRANGGSRPVHD